MAQLVVEIDSRDEAGNTRVTPIPLDNLDVLPFLTGILLRLDGQVVFATGLTEGGSQPSRLALAVALALDDGDDAAEEIP